ncbi:MAG: hypothetical protein HLUCCO16_20865 [Phormidium sp. OSCR]|nr:MAG: hypothetical protein HLUCCO16_20865 [Phormidium sp. OSCR]
MPLASCLPLLGGAGVGYASCLPLLGGAGVGYASCLLPVPYSLFPPDKKGQPKRTAQKLCYRGYLIYAIAATGIRKCGYSGKD